MIKLFLLFPLFYVTLSSLIGNYRDARHGSSLWLGEHDHQLQAIRIAGIDDSPQYHKPRPPATLAGSSPKLQRRGNCLGKLGCVASRIRRDPKTAASQTGRVSDSSTHSVRRQTTTPPNSLDEHDLPATVPRIPSEHRLAGSTNSQPGRSNSLTFEPRNKVGQSSWTNTEGRSGLTTPGNSRPGSAESGRQSVGSDVSHGDSDRRLTEDSFIPHSRRRERMDGSGYRRPSSAETEFPQSITARIPKRPASAETVYPKGSRRPSSAGSALHRTQLIPQQQFGRSTSAETIAPKDWMAGSELSYDSRRTSAVSDHSAIARWSLGG